MFSQCTAARLAGQISYGAVLLLRRMEYMAASEATKEMLWLRHLLTNLGYSHLVREQVFVGAVVMLYVTVVRRIATKCGEVSHVLGKHGSL